MLKKFAHTAESFVSCALVYSVLLLIVAGVLWRYVFNSPIMWMEELANLVYIWIVFVGAALCFSDREMVKMDFIHDLFPQRARLAINIVFDVVTIVGCGYLVPYGFKLVSSVARVKSIILQFSWVYLYLPALLVVLWFAVVGIYNLVRDIRDYRR